MGTTAAPPTSGSSSSTTPPQSQSPLRNDFGKNAANPLKPEETKKPDGAKDDSGAALQKLLQQREEVSREEALANRKKLVAGFGPNLFFIGTNSGGWHSFSPAKDEKGLKKQIKNEMLKLLAADPTIDAFYFYKGKNGVDKAMTQVATNLLADLQGPHGDWKGCGMRVSPVKMSGIEPWNDSMFGRMGRNAVDKREAEAGRKSALQANKL